MAKHTRFLFPFEKLRLLHRGKSTEIWDGMIAGRPHILRRASPGHRYHLSDYLLQSRIKHPLLLQPTLGWYGAGESFWYAMPAESLTELIPDQWNVRSFVAQILSLALNFYKRGFVFRWNPDHLFCDPKTGRPFLAGLSGLREATSEEIEEEELSLLPRLSSVLSKHGLHDKEMTSALKRWERRKKHQVTGCLEELLRESPTFMEQTVGIWEWQRERSRWGFSGIKVI